MNLSAKYLIVIMMITIAILLMMMFISKKSIMDSQKATPFECGFNPMTNKRLPFSIHFFLITVIFLIFDIEIIIIMPMVLTLKSAMIDMWMITSSMFILILIMGLFHEWNNGLLNWTN